MREGYEGLVRGNNAPPNGKGTTSPKPQTVAEAGFVHNLRFGDGELLRDGTGDHPMGRTLKGRYIVRVGWDDVRGWFAEVSCAALVPNYAD